MILLGVTNSFLMTSAILGRVLIWYNNLHFSEFEDPERQRLIQDILFRDPELAEHQPE